MGVTWGQSPEWTPRAPAKPRRLDRPSAVKFRSHDSVKSASDDDEKQFGLPDDLFELGAKVSAGSQGTVYECVRLNTQHQYAAKVINCSLSQDTRKQMLLLKREICIMRELHHPKIVNVLVAFWADDSCTIVMDLARGGDLYAKLESEVKMARDSHTTFRGLGGDEFVTKYIAKQLLEGIGYMHMNHVVHRDLKLENILITNSHSLPELEVPEVHDVKIADFGLSTVLNSINGKHCASLNLMMSAVGTPAYVAPEVLDETYDQSVDYWSFGVILYALNCGRMPFVISSLNPNRHKEAVSKIQKCESWSSISLEGQSMIRGLLKVDPEERYNMKDCLHHAWLQSSCLPDSGLNDFLGGNAIRQVSLVSTFSSDPGEVDIVGVIMRISGWTGIGLQGAEFLLADGSIMSFGDKDKILAASPKSPNVRRGRATEDFALHADPNMLYNSYDLEPDELVIAVVQSRSGAPLQTHLGDGLVFFTSRSRVLALEGTDARHRNRFIAPAGWQIVGLQFEGAVVKGTHVEKISSSGQGSVQLLCGTAGTVVDSVSFHLRDGSSHVYGADSGGKQTSYKLKSTEVVLIVEQGHVERGLGVSLVFYTSHGNVIKVAGVTFVKSLRFAVGMGQQICGLRFEGTSLGMVQTCSKSGVLDNACWHEVS
eukprot:CAMPEP_0169082056 /NCGR_PEP_ID=MMETSP1015-20121227/11339_1 /TAXON_ID=342587 /ORGANISM="Karlodinium micrum, Strain CCMP2283" /LENGTH=653 /DNA_ID=CAMNT_0009141883 /DNA_START=193 /DNA_END=2154 /DNA_ORIENTATION=+